MEIDNEKSTAKVVARRMFIDKYRNTCSDNGLFIPDIDNIPLDAKDMLVARCIHCSENCYVNRRQFRCNYCPNCGNFKSSSEQLIAKILEDNNIKYVREYLLPGRYKDDRKQKYDFYLPDLNIAIEHQGTQHYDPKNGHYNKDVEERDRLKFARSMILGIQLYYTYEKDGLMFNQLQNLFSKFNLRLVKKYGSKYPPAQKAMDLVVLNPEKSISYYTKLLEIEEHTFYRYIKMCGFVGIIDIGVYTRWKDIPDDEFLDYLSENGLRKTSKHFDRTLKVTTTHLNDLGYKNLYELQLERKTILDAIPNSIILDSIIKYKGIRCASEHLGFKKHVLEHYLLKLGYKNYTDVVNNYHKDS